VVSVTQQTIATGASLGHVTRPARALIGWMAQAEGQLVLAQRNVHQVDQPEHIERLTQARSAVEAREPGVDQSQLLSDVGQDLTEYIATFQGQPEFQPFAAEGWCVKIANLSKVCALQPIVFWDHAEERTQSAVPGNMLSLASVTLPIRTTPEALPLQFDQQRNTWIVPSRNPNLRIVGQFNAPFDTGNGRFVTGCGFLVAITPSYVQVVFHRGRYLLRDGYHRSLGLLARGMTHVPVLYREFSQFENLGIGPGMLPEHAYLGERPPLLADYLSNTVAVEVQQPASQKMIVVQGMEMNPLG
jgi:hypothetical protein